MRLTVKSALVLGSVLSVACGDGGKKGARLGDTCAVDGECQSGFCLSGQCLDPEADEDEDGIINRLEKALGTNPFEADSDGDGTPDDVEVGDLFDPLDSDGDGQLDAVESSTADADEDCIVDQADVANAQFDGASDPRVAALCPAPIGVCGGEHATLAVACTNGIDNPGCTFGGVPSHEDVETSCDQRDNDCDGETDEGCTVVDPLDVDLVGDWRLDGDAQDASPNHAHGTTTGVLPASDRFGRAAKAMAFPEGGHVDIASTTHGANDFSYAFWIAPDRAGGDVLSFNGQIVVGSRGVRGCIALGSATSDKACAPDLHWSFIAIVRNAAEVRWYLDGRRVSLGPSQAAALDATGLVIGNGFRGLIDDVRVYNRALGDAEVAALMTKDGAWPLVGSQQNPGQSCLHVRDAAGASSDGSYWLDADGFGPAQPFQATCDMTRDGGGWTLAWSYTFTEPDAFGDVGNAVTPVPDWPGSNIDVPIVTTPPTLGASGALPFARWGAVGREVMFDAPLLDLIACQPIGGSFADATPGGVDCRVVTDRTSTCDGTLPTGLGWSDTGPVLVAQSLFLYFDGATDTNWPTHDPCATNVPPSTAVDASARGYVWLRPTDRAVAKPAHCAYVPEGQRTNPVLIDPDGLGGRDPFEATCDWSTARGGWALLTVDLWQAIMDRGAAPREYLFQHDGAFYRSPMTTAVWSWTSATTVPGVWVYGGPAGEGAFRCDGGAAVGWGIGCGKTDIAHVLPGAGPSPTRNELDGLTSVCQGIPNAFQSEGDCIDDVTVWARPSGCMHDAGSELGDGGFAIAADADGPACWNLWAPAGQVVPDYDEVPPGGTAPSIAASNDVVDNDIWSINVNQSNLTFVAGRAYTLSFWAKVASPRPIRVFVQTSDLSHAFYWEDLDVTTTWQRYELRFVADTTSFAAQIDFQLAQWSTATVWLDDVRLEDAGESPCEPEPGDLLADGAFDAGRTCWRLGHDVTQTDARAMPEDGAIRIEQSGSVGNYDVSLSQRNLTIVADRHYRVSFRARAEAPRPLFVVVSDFDEGKGFLGRGLQAPVTTEWKTFTLDFVSSDGSGPGKAALDIAAGDPGGHTVWVDDVSLVEIGPDPCTPDVGSLLADGDFSEGLACWSHQYDGTVLGSTADVSSDAPSSAPSLQIDQSPGSEDVWTVDLQQAGLTIVPDHWYRLSFAAKASVARELRAAVWENGTVFTYQSPRVGTTWTTYTFDFLSGEGGTPGMSTLDFHLADASGGTVWLDDVRLEDHGPNPCSPDVGSLITDGAFDAGYLCWNVGVNGPDIASLSQETLSYAPEHWYHAELDASASAPRTMDVYFSDEGDIWLYQTVDLGTTKATYDFDFVTSASTDPGTGMMMMMWGGPSEGTVAIDDVVLRDMGTSPCLPIAGDLLLNGELVGKGLCWTRNSKDGTYGRFTADADHPVATAGPSLGVENLVADDELFDVQLIQRGFALTQGKAYTLRFWVKAAAPRTIAAMVQNWDTQTMHVYRVVDVTTEWTEVVMPFTGANTEVNALVELQFGQASTAKVWVDGLRLLEDAPVAWWTFDEGSGNVAADVIGPHEATVNGATWAPASACVDGGCLHFDGNDYVQSLVTTNIPWGAAPRTLAMWVKPEKDLASDTEAAMCQWGTNTTSNMFGLITSLNAPGFLYFFGYSADLAAGPLQRDVWQHVAVTYDATTITLYLDGDEVAASEIPLGTVIDANGVTIGWRPPGIYWTGYIDDVRIYDRALNASDISALSGVSPGATP